MARFGTPWRHRSKSILPVIGQRGPLTEILAASKEPWGPMK